MEQRKIFICMTELDYGNRLARYISSQKHAGTEVELLTGWKDKADVGKDDILLSDDPEVLEHSGCQNVLFVKTPEEQGENKIFMYRSRERIYQELLEQMGVKEGQGAEPLSKENGIVVVFSPEGGDAKTLLALKRAGELSRHNRVLYVSLCGFPVFFHPSWKEEENINTFPGITELMLRAEEDGFGEELESVAFGLGRIWSVAPINHYKDLLDFSLEDIQKFMRRLRTQNAFDTVVLELGQIFEYTLELMTYADQILVPREAGILAAIRRNVWQRYCRMEGKPDILKRIVFEETDFSAPEGEEELLQFIEGEEDSG